MAGHPPRRGIALMDLLVVLTMLVTFMGLFFAGVQRVRESSYRASCQNNLRQIGTALLNYHNSNRRFPAAQDTDHSGPTTWLKQILPYVGYEHAAAEDPVPIYLCAADRSGQEMIFRSTVAPLKADSALCPPRGRNLASRPDPNAPIYYVKYACTSYVAVVSSKNVNGPYDATMYPRSRTRASDITDGQSNTLLVGERPPSADLVWGWWASPSRGDISMGTFNTYRFANLRGGQSGKPVDCPSIPYFGPGSLSNICDVQHFWSFHPGGANWLLADGSVHFFQYKAAPQMPGMATRAGAEVIDWLQVF